jgi:hypothetical protein
MFRRPLGNEVFDRSAAHGPTPGHRECSARRSRRARRARRSPRVHRRNRVRVINAVRQHALERRANFTAPPCPRRTCPHGTRPNWAIDGSKYAWHELLDLQVAADSATRCISDRNGGRSNHALNVEQVVHEAAHPTCRTPAHIYSRNTQRVGRSLDVGLRGIWESRHAIATSRRDACNHTRGWRARSA